MSRRRNRIGTDPPVLGLSTHDTKAAWSVWRTSAVVLQRAYVDMVGRAGGVPVLIPLQEPEHADAVVGMLDGLVIAGGPDVDPERYGAARDPRTDPGQPLRDGWELALLRAASRADLPLLGICRGMQLLNVALGGTLLQHLPDVVGHDRHAPAAGVFGSHPIRTVAGTRTARVLGPKLTVPSYHHQAVDRVGTGLAASAFAADGTVEAVEAVDARFTLAVQWHPERQQDDRLIQALVDHC